MVFISILIINIINISIEVVIRRKFKGKILIKSIRPSGIFINIVAITL
jgi:hypothetical protein